MWVRIIFLSTTVEFFSLGVVMTFIITFPVARSRPGSAALRGRSAVRPGSATLSTSQHGGLFILRGSARHER